MNQDDLGDFFFVFVRFEVGYTMIKLLFLSKEFGGFGESDKKKDLQQVCLCRDPFHNPVRNLC